MAELLPAINLEVQGMIRRKSVIAGCMAGIILISACGGVLYTRKARNEDNTQASQAEVMKGSVRKMIQGTGTLAPEGTKEIMIPAGIKIREVKVKAGDEVKAGDVLATVDGNTVMAEFLGTRESLEDLQKRLKKADKSKASYYEMMKKKEQLDEKLAVLQKMKDSGSVTAETDGVVLNINSGKTKNGAEENTKTSEAQSSGSAASYISGRIWPVKMQINEAETKEKKKVIIDEIPEIKIKSPVAGEKPGTAEKTDSESEKEKKTPYSIKVKWSPGTEHFEENTVYRAYVEITAEQGFSFREGLKPSVTGAKVSEIRWQRENGADGISQISLRAEFPKTESISGENGEQQGETNSSTGEGQTENGAVSEEEKQQEKQEPSADSSQSGAQPEQVQPGAQPEKVQPEKAQPEKAQPEKVQPEKPRPGKARLENKTAGASASGISTVIDTGAGSSNAGMSTPELPPASTSTDAAAGGTTTDENTELSVFCTMAAGDKLAVEIQVDEMDILTVSQGQRAEIRLNARPERAYEGVISRVNKNGTGQGQAAKYSVQILLPKEADMLFGMSVSAEIFIEEKNDVLTIPAEAVVEQGGKTWIYTSVDEKTGELREKKEVQTGLSDGVQIEITKGAKEGQKVFYEQSVVSDFSEDYMMDGMEEEKP